MKDNEIVKDWEKVLAIGDAPIGEHWGCSVTTQLAKATFDMLNRQKAEIERLQTRNDELNALNKTATIDAIKDFWKILKRKAFGIVDADSSIKVIDVADGDNLVKEMTGEKEREN